MKTNKKILILLFIILIIVAILFTYKQKIRSQYIFNKALNIEEVNDYIDGQKNEMEIIGETWGKPRSYMQIDGYSEGERKKVAVQYTCSILCKLTFVGIDDDQGWEIVYGDIDNTSWIEDWGN